MKYFIWVTNLMRKSKGKFVENNSTIIAETMLGSIFSSLEKVMFITNARVFQGFFMGNALELFVDVLRNYFQPY